MKNKIYKKIMITQGIKDIDEFKMEMYSILTSIVYDRNIYKHNKELEELFLKLNIPCKPYLLKSRNQSIIKFLSKSTYEELVEQLQILKKVMIESMEEDNKVETNEENKESDYDILVKKYGKK